jgi:hypothetical protein
MTGIEPVNLFLTKEVLYLLSYISTSVSDRNYYNPTSDRMQGLFACIFQENHACISPPSQRESCAKKIPLNKKITKNGSFYLEGG